MRITVTVPTVAVPALASNVLGLLGLVGLIVTIGALAGNAWWSVLAGSVAALALSWVAHTHARAATPAPAVPVDEQADDTVPAAP